MVEWFNRQLKASLRAAVDPENWTNHLSLILLGIRSALKPDLDCSAAELVFGATVRLPGELISPTPRGAVEDPTNLLHRLRQFMRTLSPVPPKSSASPSYLEKDLATCSHVYLQCDRVRQPLEPPYDGPFRVLSRGPKAFRIQRDNRKEVVSVGRLKAAVPGTPPDEPCGPLPSASPMQPLFHRPVFSLCPPVRYLRLSPPTPTPPPPDVFTLLRTLYISLAVVVMYTFLIETWEDLAQNRPVWRIGVKTGGAIYEGNRIADAKMLRSHKCLVFSKPAVNCLEHAHAANVNPAYESVL
ncbi:hypothetical protein SprV_0401527700 [Sparganum proliferum]